MLKGGAMSCTVDWSGFWSNIPDNLTDSNVRQIRAKRDVPLSEKIYRSYPPRKAVAVITDKAIYFQNVRWSLNDLCKYVLVKDNGTFIIDDGVDKTFLIGDAQELGDDFSDIIIALQNYLCNKSEDARKQRKKIYARTVIPLKNKLDKFVPLCEKEEK